MDVIMKVCCIGDIHGTTKFLQCYNDILKNDNECEKIIVFGDHFDPYEYFSPEEMIEKYNEFIEICHNDERIVSLLGNHDLSSYVIWNDCTNRTARFSRPFSEVITPNLKDSYLCYRIGDYLFSHAGVSQTWFNGLNDENQQRILNNHKGWTQQELTKIVSFYDGDFSHYGNDEHQGCTWIRPDALCDDPLGEYNQVVAHTIVDEITKVEMSNRKDLWLIDDGRKPNYLTLNI